MAHVTHIVFHSMLFPLSPTDQSTQWPWYNCVTMSICQHCLKKTFPCPNNIYAFSQQELAFQDSEKEGLFVVCECNIHHNDLVFCCFFLAFYQDYLVCLINWHTLYIKVWVWHYNQALKSLPDLADTFKYLRHLINFMDRVVGMCLNNANTQLESSIWVPTLLWEWLILEFNIGHGFKKAQEWIRGCFPMSHWSIVHFNYTIHFNLI